jgi:hypothetical protein
LGVETFTLGIETFTLGVETFTLGIETFTLGVETFTLGVETFTLGVERLVARGVEMLRLGALGVERLVARGVESLTALLEMLARAIGAAVTGARSTLLPTCLKPEEPFEVLVGPTLACVEWVGCPDSMAFTTFTNPLALLKSISPA